MGAVLGDRDAGRPAARGRRRAGSRRRPGRRSAPRSPEPVGPRSCPQHLVEGLLHPVGVLAVLHQRPERAGGGLEVELGGAEVVQGPGPVEGLGDPGRLLQVVAAAQLLDDARRPARASASDTSGARERTICDLALEAGVLDPVVEAAPLERVVQLAGAVGGEDDDRRGRGLDGAELGDASPGRSRAPRAGTPRTRRRPGRPRRPAAPPGSAGARPAPGARAGTARRTGSSRPPRRRRRPRPASSARRCRIWRGKSQS